MEVLTTERNNIYNSKVDNRINNIIDNRTDKRQSRDLNLKIAGIIRWLERCQNSYKSGAIESALMDAECARADLEDLRINVWSKVESKAIGRRFRFNFMALSCVIASALLLIMLTAAPVSRDINNLAAYDILKNKNIAAEKLDVKKLDGTEKIGKEKKVEKSENFIAKSIEKNDIREKNIEIKNNSLEILKNENLKAVRGVKHTRSVKAERIVKKQAEQPERSERALKAEKVFKAEFKSEVRAENKKPEKVLKKVEKAEKIVPYDKMFSLLETGARALRNETPLIEIK